MFRVRIPDYMRHIREEYLKWASDTTRYKRLYPISYAVLSHLAINKGNYYGTTKKHQDKCCYTPHKREKLKRGKLSPKDEEPTKKY